MVKTFTEYFLETGVDYNTHSHYEIGFLLAQAVKAKAEEQGPQYRSELITELKKQRQFYFLFGAGSLKKTLGVKTNLKRVGLLTTNLGKIFEQIQDEELKRLGIDKEVMESFAQIDFRLKSNTESPFKVRADYLVDYLPEQHPIAFINNRVRQRIVTIEYLF